MFTNKCNCKNRDNDGLCKYKFLKGEKLILCGNPKKRKVLECIESEEQLRILKRRINAK